MQSENGKNRKYLYGIIQCSASRRLGIVGIDDSPVRSVSHGSIAAAISDVMRDDFTQDLSAIARHECVLESLMEKYPLLPSRFGTTFSDAQLNDVLGHGHDRFLRDLQRVQNRVEFNLRILWPVSELRSVIEHNEVFAGALAETGEESGPGTRYAILKRRDLTIDRILQARAQAYVEIVQRALLPLCSECRCEVAPADGVMLEGAYLVERKGSNDFRNAIDLMQSESSRFCYVLTGPWPPYSFMSLHESLFSAAAAPMHA